jgi:type III pantothenate kinase
LLVDVGNTRLKWALQDGTELSDCRAQEYTVAQLPHLLDEYWREIPVPGQIYVANVSGEEVAQAITSYSRGRWQQEPVYATVKPVAAGVTNAYRDITQLGIDRWLAVIAAWSKYRSPLLVAGCGTALTIDVVDGDGHHLGGLIIPGLRLMQDYLNTGTRGINTAAVRTPALGLGDSTADCIANGAACAMVSAIERVAEESRHKFGADLQRIIMGGDAEVVNSLLREPFILEPNLVLEGLGLDTTPE